MTGLNWFQARALGHLQGRAIRRDGWKQWLIFRFHQWLISEVDPVTGLERRRVPQAIDFRDSEFLSKDWTDEVWEGGSYPPCTTPGPATALAGNDTGGAAAWTMTEACGGDGTGGNILPPDLTPSEPPAPDDDPDAPWVFQAIALDDDMTPLDYTDNHVLVPDGGACWNTPPDTCSLVVIAGRRQPDGNVNNSVGTRGLTTIGIYMCTVGDALTGPDVSPFMYPAPEFGYFGTTDTVHYGATPISGVHKHAPTLATALRLPGGVGTGLLLGGVTYSYGTIFTDCPYTPGATYKFRVEESAPTFGTPTPAGKITRFYELLLPPLCEVDD